MKRNRRRDVNRTPTDNVDQDVRQGHSTANEITQEQERDRQLDSVSKKTKAAAQALSQLIEDLKCMAEMVSDCHDPVRVSAIIELCRLCQVVRDCDNPDDLRVVVTRLHAVKRRSRGRGRPKDQWNSRAIELLKQSYRETLIAADEKLIEKMPDELKGNPVAIRAHFHKLSSRKRTAIAREALAGSERPWNPVNQKLLWKAVKQRLDREVEQFLESTK